MLASLAFVFSVSLPSLVIWPKIWFYARDTHFGGPSRSNAIASIGVNGASTRISGVSLSPDATQRLSDGRVAELESQVSKLKLELEQKNTEVLQLSVNVQQAMPPDSTELDMSASARTKNSSNDG